METRSGTQFVCDAPKEARLIATAWGDVIVVSPHAETFILRDGKKLTMHDICNPPLVLPHGI